MLGSSPTPASCVDLEDGITALPPQACPFSCGEGGPEGRCQTRYQRLPKTPTLAALRLFSSVGQRHRTSTLVVPFEV